MNNQYRLMTNTDPVLAWFQLRRILTGRREEAASVAMHLALDELIKPPQSPDSANQILPHRPRVAKSR